MRQVHLIIVFNLEQDVQGSQQREGDVQKDMASIVTADGGPVLAAG